MNTAQAEVANTAKTKGRSKHSAKQSKPLLVETSPSDVDEKRTQSIEKSKPKASAVRSGKKRKEKDKEKSAKPKVVRDSFTIPEAEYESIGALKRTCLALGVAVKKSELLRAGLALLTKLSGEELKQVVTQIENIKTGRPAGKAKKDKVEG